MKSSNNRSTTSRSTSQDRQRVAGSQDWEISYMAKKYLISEEQVKEAIQKVGNSRYKIEDYLSSKE